VVLLEKEAELGGLGRSVLHNGNFYDLGTHIFHTDDAALLRRIREAAGARLIESRQKIRIKWNNRLYQYPISVKDLFRKLPPATLLGCGTSLLRARVFGPREIRSAEDQFIRDYGSRLYEIFFRSYTERHWGVPACELDPRLVQHRIQKTDLFRILAATARNLSGRRSVHHGAEVQPVADTLYYTAQGSGGLFSLLGARLEELGVDVRTDSELVGLEHGDGRIFRAVCRGPEGRADVDCDAVVSTLPLDRLPALLGRSVDKEAHGLPVRSLIVSGLLVNRPEVLDANFVYFQDALFGRVSEPKRVGLLVDPADHTILLCEVACSRGDERWRDPEKVTDEVIRELMREGCLRSSGEVVDRISIPVPAAYPVYRKGFFERVEELGKQLGAFSNLFSAGRWGEFRYINMHVAMLCGQHAAGRASAYLMQKGETAGGETTEDIT